MTFKAVRSQHSPAVRPEKDLDIWMILVPGETYDRLQKLAEKIGVTVNETIMIALQELEERVDESD